jgi:hypothetical protein
MLGRGIEASTASHAFDGLRLSGSTSGSLREESRVVETSLQDDEIVAIDEVDQSMLLADAT